PDVPIISLDDLRGEFGVDPGDDQGEVVQAARERCRAHLRAGRSFCFNATNIVRQTRRRWIDVFADYDARIGVVYIETPMPLILAQNARRSVPVPERVVRHLAERIEPPTFAESHGLSFAGSGAVVKS